MNSILVYLQTSPTGGLHPISREMASIALSLSDDTHGVLMATHFSERLEKDILELGLKSLQVYLNGSFEVFEARVFAAAMLNCSQALSPTVVLAGATPEGRALAPTFAGLAGAGVTADCTGLTLSDDGELVQIRPAFGGNVMAEIVTPKARPQVATVRMGAIACQALEKKRTTQVEFREAALPEPLEKYIVGIAAEEQPKDVIIALGGGLADKDQLKMFEDMGKRADAYIMCSRSLVERGWFGQGKQIGLSGRSVSPRLLIAFGISGSVQFMSGAKGAGRLVAVNIDRNAPILQFADVPIVGDLREIAPMVIEKLRTTGS